jgi:prepilin-type N-terminal cleavage/methylation domain-containing protein
MSVQLLTRLRRDERGFTLVELLATMSIGLIILFAVLGLMTTMVRSSAESRGRQQAVREGRTALDRVGQELRLASCPDLGSAIISGNGTTVSYWAERPFPDYTRNPVTERHTLTYDATAQRLSLTVNTLVSMASGTPQWSAPSRQEVLGNRLALVGTTPFFQYRAFTAPNSSTTVPIANSPLTADDLSDVAQVQVTFNALPDYGDAQAAGSRFDSRIVLRTDDPTDQDNTPQC